MKNLRCLMIIWIAFSLYGCKYPISGAKVSFDRNTKTITVDDCHYSYVFNQSYGLDFNELDEYIYKTLTKRCSYHIWDKKRIDSVEVILISYHNDKYGYEYSTQNSIGKYSVEDAERYKEYKWWHNDNKSILRVFPFLKN